MMIGCTSVMGTRAISRHAVLKGLARSRQQGISLIEVAIVTAIVVLVVIIGISALGAFVIEHKVPKVAEALQRFALRT